MALPFCAAVKPVTSAGAVVLPATTCPAAVVQADFTPSVLTARTRTS